MKKLLLITLIFCSFTCFAQNLPTQQALYEGCNVIVIETADRAPNAFMKMQKALKDGGFTVTETDKDIFTISATQTLAGTGDITINASINQGGSSQIILNGTMAAGSEKNTKSATASTGPKIENSGDKDSAAKKAFDKMHEVALSYKGAKVLYGTN